MHKKIKIGEKEKKERKVIQTWKHKNFLLDKTNHISIINQLFLNQSFEGENTTKKELQKKLNSYKQQDIKKDKNENGLISYQELLEKLVISKLRCYYCKKEALLLYENNREQKQWTLDRLDNSCGHTKDNVVIACLKCNLERRCLNDEKFLFTKQMRLIKKS